jgi:hypothetical protein
MSRTVDAPTIRFDKLTARQQQGTSCCWCAGTADRRFPVHMPIGGVRVYACACCAGMYGVSPTRVDR